MFYYEFRLKLKSHNFQFAITSFTRNWFILFEFFIAVIFLFGKKLIILKEKEKTYIRTTGIYVILFALQGNYPSHMANPYVIILIMLYTRDNWYLLAWDCGVVRKRWLWIWKGKFFGQKPGMGFSIAALNAGEKFSGTR